MAPSQSRLAATARTILVQLNNVDLDTQKRDGKDFGLAWQFSMGITTNAAGATGFELDREHVYPVPGVPGRAAKIVPVLNNPNVPDYQQEIWKNCVSLILQINKNWAGVKQEFGVSISKLDSPDQFVHVHVDPRDVCRQIAVFLGNFSGAFLKLYSASGTFEEVELYPGLVLDMDGRLPHELVLRDFKGVRYALFFYKNFDSRLTSPTVITSEYTAGSIDMDA